MSESIEPSGPVREVRAMVDLVTQLREGVEKKYSRESLETMLTWAADEIERLRRTLRDLEFYENDPWARNKIRVALGMSGVWR